MDQSLIDEFTQMVFRLQKVKILNLVNNLNTREVYTMLRINEQKENLNQICFHEELEKHLAVTKSAISQIISSLEEKGIITRAIDNNDRRKFELSITGKGQELVEELRTTMDSVIKETITRFGEDNMRQFIRLFNQFADTLAAVKEEELSK